MEFFEAVEKRRSVRQFTAEEIPRVVIEKALSAALLAPNSSNLQPWEFYWVRSADKKAALVEACFSQSAARTASELVVAVSRVDTWRRNRRLLVEELGPGIPKFAKDYYQKVVPVSYLQDPFGVLALAKKVLFNTAGLLRPMPRGPATRADLFEVVTKTTALACENFMLAITAEGFATCPMEGFDEARVKRLLGLGRHARVVMVLGAGRANPDSHTIERYRVPRELVVKEV